MKHTKKQLQQRQALPLYSKEQMTEVRIREWWDYWEGEVYVAFSGGKDSTVLLHQVRRIYPNVPAVFIDTGLEFPEIREFVKTIENVTWLKPPMSFVEVIEKYGYPVVSKEEAQKIREIRNTKSEKLRNKRLYGDEKGHGKLPLKWRYLIDAEFKISEECCLALKKRPAKAYEKETNEKSFTGMMASDSRGRTFSYLRRGCNSFNTNKLVSNPLSFWVEQDIWDYLSKYNVPYSEIYNMGYTNTGCMFCMFGVHMEKGKNKFQMMKETHPRQYDYCINRLGCGKVLDSIKVEY